MEEIEVWEGAARADLADLLGAGARAEVVGEVADEDH